jgi:DNA ligase 1
MMTLYPKLYKKDSAGRLRFWQMELDGDRYRTISGLVDGNPVESGWTTAVPASQPNGPQQAMFEVNAKYRHQLDREYHETPDTVDTPNFFEPMLAQKFKSWSGPCWSQPKLDGIRCIARAEGLFSRQGQPITAVPHIEEALAPIFARDPDAVLDGELYNHELADDFGEISSIVRKKKPSAEDLAKARQHMQYHVYDMPSVDGDFRARMIAAHHTVFGNDALPKESLEAPGGGVIYLEHQAMIRMVDTRFCEDADELDDLYGNYLNAGYEGQMIRLAGPYEQKRSKLLLKRKEFTDQEFECVEILPGNGNWAGLAKRVTCRLPDGRTFGAGIKGNASRAAELLNETHKVVTVQYFQLSPDGIPRFPVATKFHGAERTL